MNTDKFNAVLKGIRMVGSFKNIKGWLFVSLMGGCYLSFRFASFYKELGSISGVSICGIVCVVLFLMAILSLLSTSQKLSPGSEPEGANKLKEEKEQISVAPVKKMGKRKGNKKDSKSALEQSETHSRQVSFLITENNNNYKKKINIVNTPTLSASFNNSDQTKKGINFYEGKVIYLLTLNEKSEILQGSDFLKIDELRNFSLN